MLFALFHVDACFEWDGPWETTPVLFRHNSDDPDTQISPKSYYFLLQKCSMVQQTNVQKRIFLTCEKLKDYVKSSNKKWSFHQTEKEGVIY